MINVDAVIETAILELLNQWPDRPCEISLEFSKRKPINYAMTMQQLSGAVALRKYVDGSFIGAWPFIVIVRTSGTDTEKRLGSTGLLNSLNNWLQEVEMPDIGEGRIANYFEMTALPALSGSYEDGSADYQATYRLVYKQSA